MDTKKKEKNRTIQVNNQATLELIDTKTRTTKTQHVIRDNVNYLWKIGLSRSMNVNKIGLSRINNNKKLKDIDPIIEEAIGRILENPSSTPSSNQSVALFCTTCKNIFIPGKNCTVRTLTKLRKKHELHKRKKRHGKNKKKTINKGLVYTCKICGNRETIGMLTQRRNNRKT